MSRADWSALLDGFEAELAAPGIAASPWHPVDTPLPDDLVDRARDLVSRQHARMAALRHDLAEVRAHLGAVERIPAARDDAAAYLDLDG